MPYNVEVVSPPLTNVTSLYPMYRYRIRACASVWACAWLAWTRPRGRLGGL